MIDDLENLKKGGEAIDRWWHWIRPWWHVATFIVLMVSIITIKLSEVEAYSGRITSLENQMASTSQTQQKQGQDIAVMKQQVSDIHDYLIPKGSPSR